MFNSPVVEIAVGLILIYLVLGLLCTSINEYIAQLLSLRSENLADAIYGLFNGKDADRIAEDILQHPLVTSLCKKQTGLNLFPHQNADPDAESSWWSKIAKISNVVKLPSSIPAETFSAVVKDLMGNQTEKQYDEDVTKLLGLVGIPIGGVAAADTTKLEDWYNAAMDRSKGWYKRRIQVVSFLVSMALVIVVNADTFMIVKSLTTMPTERAKLAAFAPQVKSTNHSEGGSNTAANNAACGADQEEAVTIPPGMQDAAFSFLGWTDSAGSDLRKVPNGFYEWVAKILGLCLTAFAASLGAPFWFDMLSKFMTVRTGGDPPPKPAKGGV